jgi:ribosomal-protein-alanine N-acetyltransferase
MIRRATPADWPMLETIQIGASQWAGYAVWVIDCDSQVAGFVAVREVAAGECEILDIAVAGEFRRRGLATALLQYALRTTPGTYFLEVRKSNHNARSLYRRLGFEQTGERRDYYSNPDEAAIVMRFLS